MSAKDTKPEARVGLNLPLVECDIRQVDQCNGSEKLMITPTDHETKKCGLFEADVDLKQPFWLRHYPDNYLLLLCLSPPFLVDVRLSKRDRSAKAHHQIQITSKYTKTFH